VVSIFTDEQKNYTSQSNRSVEISAQKPSSQSSEYNDSLKLNVGFAGRYLSSEKRSL
jgi:hypothetical protein